MTIQQIHIRKDRLDQVQRVDVGPTELADGAVRLAIESFAITANNITYAVVGDDFGYWSFFPAPDAMGIVPVWGHAQVAESHCAALPVGERVYGYLPMASHLDVVPGKVTASGFVDISAHRQPMSPVYNQYARLSADPEHDPEREAERMIFGPLFKTGFLIDYFMRTNSWFGAERLIITSASSKTAMGMASVSKQLSPDVQRIGLTSPGNIAFVQSTGLYDDVLSYAEIAALAGRPAVLVDFAGNAGLLAQIHEGLEGSLAYSCLVGATHIHARGSAMGRAPGLPGPEPTIFFAPDHALALLKELGPQGAGKQIAKAWHGFLNDVGGTVSIERYHGLEAATELFLATLAGDVDPAKGIIVEL